MSLPYFPMYPTDFEAKTSHLTLAEDGAYNRLLRICWMTPGCTMPDDETWIMRRARAASEQEREAIRAVLAEFFTVIDGRHSNARLAREWLAANEAHERRKSAGSKGGKVKALNKKEKMPSNALALSKQPEPEPEPDKEVVAAAVREREGDDLHSKIMHVVGLTSGRIPVHWMPPAATMHVNRWSADLGLTEEEILETARHSRARYADPPAGPKALDRAMQATAAAKIAPQMKPAKGYSNGKPMSETRAFDSAMRQLASKMADGTAALETDSRDPWLYADAVLRDTKPGQH